MGAVTYPDPAVVAELEGWKRLSFDTDERGDVAAAFGVTSLPAAVALDGDGRVLATIRGFQSAGSLVAKLKAAREQR